MQVDFSGLLSGFVSAVRQFWYLFALAIAAGVMGLRRR